MLLHSFIRNGGPVGGVVWAVWGKLLPQRFKAFEIRILIQFSIIIAQPVTLISSEYCTHSSNHICDNDPTVSDAVCSALQQNWFKGCMKVLNRKC